MKPAPKDLVLPKPTAIPGAKELGLQIVVLDRGWVFVGYVSEDGEYVYIDNANVVRTWGTDKGLGQIAMNGPTSSTVLDPVSRVRCSERARLFMLECTEDAWGSVYKRR